MDNEFMIKRLMQLEAYAEVFREECYNTRKMLEADSSATSTPKGHLQELAALEVARRNNRMAIRAQMVQNQK